jgi:hypothetical protein
MCIVVPSTDKTTSDPRYNCNIVEIGSKLYPPTLIQYEICSSTLVSYLRYLCLLYSSIVVCVVVSLGGFVFVLCLVYPMLSVSLEYPFF